MGLASLTRLYETAGIQALRRDHRGLRHFRSPANPHQCGNLRLWIRPRRAAYFDETVLQEVSERIADHLHIAVDELKVSGYGIGDEINGVDGAKMLGVGALARGRPGGGFVAEQPMLELRLMGAVALELLEDMVVRLRAGRFAVVSSSASFAIGRWGQTKTWPTGP